MSTASENQILDEARALLEEGEVDRARDAFRRAIEVRPDDASALVDLGHLELAAGSKEEAIGYFEQALERDPANASALLALTEVRRRESRFDDALTAALRAAESRPDDVGTILDAADLALELDRLDEAEGLFRRARSIDDEPDHEVYSYHGLIEVELRRERWRRALDLAVDATRVDRLGATTDVLAFMVSQVFGVSDRPAPPRDHVERLLAVSRSEHRRLHAGTLG